jgi:integrase
MRQFVGEYLAMRRKLGFALHVEGQELERFGRFVDQIGHAGPITTEIALRWATLPSRTDGLYHARRLDIVRRFARYQAALDPSTEIPPEGLLGPSYRRPVPHIYSDGEIVELLEVAADLGPAAGLRPHTYTTLLGLLASTGLRISEALGLDRHDVDLDSQLITVAAGKFHKSRLVPIDATAVPALRAYRDRRDRYKRPPRTTRFFVSEYGTSLKYSKVITTFVKLRRQLGWTIGRGGCLPRLHDLRHTFVVRRVLRWYEAGDDVDLRMASLSTYLGHAKVSDTYWYLTAVPELLAIPAARFERFAACVELEDAP